MKPYLLALSFGNFAVGFGALMIAGILRPMADGLEVSLSLAGQLVTVYALTYAVGSPILIGLTGAWSRKQVLLAGLGLVALGSVIAAVAPNYALVALGRVLAACGAALYSPVASGVAAALSDPQHRSQAIGVVFGGISIATAIGVPLAAYLSYNLSWHGPFWVVAGLALMAAAWVSQAVPSGVSLPRPNLKVWLEVIQKPLLSLALLAMVAQISGQFIVFTYITPILNTYLGAGAGLISMLLLVFGVASVIGTFGSGYFADKYGASTVLTVSIVGLALVFALFPLMQGSVLLAVVLLIAWGIVGFAFNAPQQARLVGLAGPAAGAVLSLNAAALYLGNAFGAALGGWLLPLGAANLHWPAALVVVLALGAFMASRRLETRSKIA